MQDTLLKKIPVECLRTVGDAKNKQMTAQPGKKDRIQIMAGSGCSLGCPQMLGTGEGSRVYRCTWNKTFSAIGGVTGS